VGQKNSAGVQSYDRKGGSDRHKWALQFTSLFCLSFSSTTTNRPATKIHQVQTCPLLTLAGKTPYALGIPWALSLVAG